MKLLLDTHVFLFAINEPERLSPKVHSLLLDPNVPRWFSAISLWEIAVKIQIGKLDLPQESEFYLRHMLLLKAQVLDVGLRHSLGVLGLPLHHKDPLVSGYFFEKTRKSFQVNNIQAIPSGTI